MMWTTMVQQASHRSPILSTEEAAVYLHSVVHEFDCTDPFKAALNAFCLRGELVLEVTAPIHEDIAVPIVISPHVNDLWCDSCAYETVNDPDQYGRSIPEVVANCRTCPQDSDPSPITCSENSRPQPNDKASDSKCSIPRPLTHLFAAASDADEQDKALLESTEDEITLFSFGYNRRFIERRSLQLRRDDLRRWRQLLRDQWMDHEGGHFDVHGIVPPPVLGKSTISAIVQLSEVPEQSALGLIQFIPSHGQPETPFVEAFPRRVTRSIVFNICGKDADAESTAVIKQGFKLWFAGEVQWIRHGVFLRILVDDPMDDDIGLFQTTISTFEQCKSETPFLTSRLLDERRAHRVEADRGQQQATPHDQEGTTHLPAGTSRLYPWHLWESFFNDQNNHEEGGVQLAVYGLALESVGTRYTILHEPSRRSLIRRVRALYPENDAWDLRIHFVTPQPVDTQRMTHVLAEFLPTDHPGMGNLCPVLFDVRWFRSGGLHREYRAAVYKPSPSTRLELLDDLFPRCFPDGDLLCSIWTRGLPCVDGHVAALHRGDFVQLRLMPTWTETIPRGGVSSAEEFYNYGIQATHWGEIGQIPLHFVFVHGPLHSTSVRTFHVNTLMEISLFADSIWGPTSLITFVREASDLRRGWYFLVSDTLTDGIPVLVDRQVRMEDGDIARQPTAVIVHSGITLRELIRSNFDETWSNDSALRETFINLTPISPELYDQAFQPTPGTLVTIFHQSRDASPLEEPQRLPDVPSEPSSDEFTLMQQGASVSTPSERTQAPFVVHIFARRNRHTAFESETLDHMRDQVVEQWELPLTGDLSIAALHTIAFPPHFVTGSDTQAFIVEHRGDAMYRANVDDVLIVVQIRFQHVRTRYVKDRVHVAWTPL